MSCGLSASTDARPRLCAGAISQRAELNLETTFSDLSSQGWISLAFIALGFGLMVGDVVGGGRCWCLHSGCKGVHW